MRCLELGESHRELVDVEEDGQAREPESGDEGKARDTVRVHHIGPPSARAQALQRQARAPDYSRGHLRVAGFPRPG